MAFALVASEFMPVSLLTPIARELNLSEGVAGQGIAVSGLFALLTSLLIASVAARVERKLLLVSLTLLLIISGSVVAFAPDVSVFMGATIGGLVFDSLGYRATFELSAGLLVISAVLTVLAGRAGVVRELVRC